MTSPIKKFIVLLIAGITISFFSVPTLYAQTGTYLYYIMVNTKGILDQVNNLPNYLHGLGEFILSWMKTDDSETTKKIQADFASLGNLIVQDSNDQNTMQPQITADLFSMPPPNAPYTIADLTAPVTAQNSILRKIPNVNEMTYSTFLAKPPSPKAPNVSQAPYGYLKNASGLNIVHTTPGLTWQGTSEDQYRYASYYNTIMSIESFNAYVLSNQYIEGQKGNPFSDVQNKLIAQAADSSWIAEIATEELGKVLRQLLMFQSQTYVLLTQLIQTQKQLLTAQVMTNSLIILNNQVSEPLLVAKAQGVRPQP